MPEFKWSGKKEEAAVLVAEDRLSNEDIAASIGVTRQTVDKWKRYPEFAARVDSVIAAMAVAVKDRGIASRERRVEALDDRWRRMRRVIDARAAQYAGVPGGDSGLLVRVGGHGRGDRGQGSAQQLALWGGQEDVEVGEYVLDAGLLKELREHEKQAARELGQWESAEEPSDLLAIAADELLMELTQGDEWKV